MGRGPREDQGPINHKADIPGPVFQVSSRLQARTAKNIKRQRKVNQCAAFLVSYIGGHFHYCVNVFAVSSTYITFISDC